MTWDFPTIAALCVFVATYVLISLQKIHFLNLDRPTAALAGATLIVGLGVVSMKQAYAAVNYDTILLLLGMMILVAHLKAAGFFEWLGVWILRHARTPVRLLWLVVFSSGLLSALFVNDTICVLLTPIILEAALRARLNPAPYLIALVTGANIGSVMTLTGNPQNMLVGIFSDIHFGKFFLVLGPIGLVGLAIDAALIAWLYRGRLGEQFDGSVFALPPLDVRLVQRVVFALVLVLAGFLLPWPSFVKLDPGQNLPFAAMAGAVLIVLIGRVPPARVLAGVDWSLLLFFACLFVVIQGVGATGLLEAMRRVADPAFGGTAASQATAMSGFAVVMSNVVSNVPFVLVVSHWMGGFEARELMWFIVAMASTFAGNLTIVGSVANMIVLELSRERAPLGFFEYLRVGVPVTLITTALGTAALLGMHAFGVL
jgi:Na+/H+ antiporter NhaD/arsenite permease-like protein